MDRRPRLTHQTAGQDFSGRQGLVEYGLEEPPVHRANSHSFGGRLKQLAERTFGVVESYANPELGRPLDALRSGAPR